jgi:hypothetical protein
MGRKKEGILLMDELLKGLSPEATEFFNQFHDFFTENFHIKKDEMDRILEWYKEWNMERPEDGYLGEDD